jgi:uncharacterized protein YndB with AHSA1/START domain
VDAAVRDLVADVAHDQRRPGRDHVRAALGGRIFERGADGGEHEWGTILEWQPPTRLRYLWHLFFDPSEATEVEITFTARGPDTAVRLEQRGFARLGEAGPVRRERTGRAWATITARFIAAI